jgi:UDP-glucose 4-epimerase
MYVQKAPANTIGILASALLQLYKCSNPVITIGTRHGEKLYETLVNREEMVKSIDLGNYFRIPADNRDLNYEQFFSVGEDDISKRDDYHSHNTKQLNIEETKKLLLKLEEIKKDIETN